MKKGDIIKNYHGVFIDAYRRMKVHSSFATEQIKETPDIDSVFILIFSPVK